jgi:sugar lactone lactonase YvrE/thiol-disulfide isomerase/thioredoxin
MKRTLTLAALASALLLIFLLGNVLTPEYALRAQPGSTPTATRAGGALVATPTPMQSYAGKARAPEFPPGLDWINVDQPLTIAGLRGRVVLLDFWTYGCINCIHIIPDLKRLEAEFGDSLAVIGVHSAKFENEGDTDNIRMIAERYGLEHPVVNDRDYRIWSAYSVRAWPTIMVIDPEGKVLGYLAGEGVYDALQPVIEGMIAEFAAQNLMTSAPLPYSIEESAESSTSLDFPGKVLADAPGNRLFISDTNHHRVVVARLDTFEVLEVIGGADGQAGLTDGDYASAQFNWPHGLALDAASDTLYVADTGNHAIRAVDLAAQTVRTVAGTGEQNRNFRTRIQRGPAATMDLNSPWDIVFHEGILYIAMAGPHQLWALNIADGEIGTHAGSGAEGLVDGPQLQAQLAQPSGITVSADGETLYFADSESSSIRSSDVDPDGQVRTLVGVGLFDFGDVDGTGDEVRLQHALGVAAAPDGLLYVADTYNSKIKVVDPTTHESRTLFGGDHGLRDGKDPQFYEPGGLSYAEGKLYIADTNNHVIRIADLASGSVSTVKFPNEQALRLGPVSVVSKGTPIPAATDAPQPDFFGEVVRLEPVSAAPGAGRIVLDVLLPEGYALNDQAPFTMHVYNDNPVASVAAEANDLSITVPDMPVTVPVTLAEGEADVTIDAAIFYCEKVNENLCFPLNVRFVVPLSVEAGSTPDVLITYSVTPPVLPGNSLGGN